MQVCFDLLIPKTCFGGDFPFQEVLAFWGDESFSQEPPRYAWKEDVKFKKQSMPEHMLNYLPSEMNVSNWVYLSLESNALEIWEKSVNEPYLDESPLMLKEMLEKLLPLLSEWVVIFELNGDQIDNVYQMNKSALLDKIDAALNWDNEPEGFLAWYKS
ncbi:hypothetical protein JF50_18040 [Pseudoalteromonas luteoviolacea]|uniref:Uncharacterized protein n=1 Tax=Pseudoalteromonas luteoviolacea TaxID=43657 RepID=A0A0C1MH03_9GAMM|nr:hypothetical protein [Pseudoalteromonas luteoviolacea]KID56179.1 hypothetical protein JF50_18040 [Pseudoalteromonas luteoviolacea]